MRATKRVLHISGGLPGPVYLLAFDVDGPHA